MSDGGELEFGGLGGGIRVETESMSIDLAGWTTTGTWLRSAELLLTSAYAVAVEADDDPVLATVVEGLEEVRLALVGIIETTQSTINGLESAITTYSEGEAMNQSILDTTIAMQMGQVGTLVRPLLTVAGLMVLAGPQFESDDPEPITDLSADTDLGWLQPLMILLSDRGAVDAAGSAIGGMDDLLFGPLGPGISFLLGQQGAGVFSTAVSAGALLAVANSAGHLIEGPVRAVRTNERETDAAHGVVERLDRIPGGADDPGAQIRIDRISVPGQADRFEVYLAGTVSFDTVSREQGFDFTSNVAAVAGVSSGALRATELAMADAGVTSTSQVAFVGHSQGGLIATILAASGDYNATSLLTIGAPTGEIEIPPSLNAIIVKHSEDLVTVLGGNQVKTDALIVERQLYDSPDDVPLDKSVPAHHFGAYLETGFMLDVSAAPQARTAVARLDQLTEGASSVTSTSYFAERLDAGVTTEKIRGGRVR